MESYSQWVKRLRIALPVGALCLLVIIFAWPLLQPIWVSKIGAVNKTPDELTVVKAHYASQDDRNRPFEITAERATQKDSQPDILRLETPTAQITLESGTVLSANAMNGVYNKAEKNLSLTGNVQIHRDDGLEIMTEQTLVDLESGSAQSDTPTQSNSPRGIMNGQGFIWDGVNRVLTVKGPARAVLLPKTEEEVRGEK